MFDPRKIAIENYTYHLPEEKVALYPLQERDASKLLVYKNENLKEDNYNNIANYIAPGSLLVFNNTKVINARIRFAKSSGAIIEIFCLEPYELNNEYSSVMNKKTSVKWKCFVGGAAKWKEAALEKNLQIDDEAVIIKAAMLEKLSDAYVIEFTWNPPSYSFAEIIEHAGDVPLPPYIKRTTDIADTERYQTIYAKFDGSVAAPTAGLHFTKNIFEQLQKKNIQHEYITLHVGAGTFKPVKAALMQQHEMHAEWIDVSINSIKNLLNNQEAIVAVGTTSARTLETLFWLGVKAFQQPDIKELSLLQWDVYEPELSNTTVNVTEAFTALMKWIELQKKTGLFTQTQLLITPGYTFRVIKALVTNFHQPQSTLLLLVAAATNGKWRNLYDYAMAHDFRFLSYGDGNLIFIEQNQKID